MTLSVFHDTVVVVPLTHRVIRDRPPELITSIFTAAYNCVAAHFQPTAWMLHEALPGNMPTMVNLGFGGYLYEQAD
jgi:hypothetical protein